VVICLTAGCQHGGPTLLRLYRFAAVRFEDWPSENGNGEVNGSAHAPTGSPEQEPGFCRAVAMFNQRST
jgi:hypothetical protein